MADYSKIRYVILDVDGTLTDGGIYYDAQGNEIKCFDAKDGLGIKVGIAAGLVFVIITGRVSPMVERRARELGIQHIISGAQVKYPEMLNWMNKHGVTAEEICYIGDDWNDLECMKAAAVCMCPADAAKEVREECDFISDSLAGHGAVRECLEELLSHNNRWEKACKEHYFYE